MKDIFPTLIGNESLRQALSGNLSHAYIIDGAPGSGRLTSARLAAMAVLCENREHDNHPLPCGRCSVCSRILRGIHPDVLEFSCGSKKSIGVETAREIRSQVFIAPTESVCKFFVIRDADLMTPEAQNALLISLEEPPEFSVFFLITKDRSLLLETIRSRCVILSTEKLSDDAVSDILEGTPEGGQLKVLDPAAFDEIVRLSDGSVGEGIRLLSDRSGEALEVRNLASELIRAIFSGTQSEKVQLASSFPKSKDMLEKIFACAILIIRDIIAKKMHTDSEPLFFGDLSDAPFTATPLRRLMAVTASLDDGISSLRGNISPLLTAERIIMQKL